MKAKTGNINYEGMLDFLKKYIRKHIALSEKEFKDCIKYFHPRELRKGQFLLQNGEVSKYLAFVVKGCLRQYSIDGSGEEHVVQFAIEEWWISDMYSSLTGTPASFNIDALEDSELLLLDVAKYEELCIEIPKFERLFRLLLQNNLIAKERRIAASLSEPAEQQYLTLIKTYPQLAQRVPLHQIASYLGITPQSLSRIRKELSTHKQGN